MRLLFSLLLLSFLAPACSQSEGPPSDPESASIFNFDRYLALGDSYTIGESVAEDQRWPNQLVERLRSKNIWFDSTLIVATSGWTTDELSVGMDDAGLQAPWDLVSLLIGVNNQFRGCPLSDFADEFEQLLLRAVALAGGETGRVFVVSIPDYGYTPFGQGNQAGISQGIDEFNTASRTITESYGIDYYDITPISRQDTSGWVANDNLHPSGSQYTAWVRSFCEAVADQLVE
ncbi:MAG: SGNH/GDSL hydrolase family protein [Bacteroidota bacterium]